MTYALVFWFIVAGPDAGQSVSLGAGGAVVISSGVHQLSPRFFAEMSERLRRRPPEA